MAVRSIRAPNNLVLIAAGIALLLLAARSAGIAVASANRAGIPVMGLVALGGAWDAILGTALIVVALRRSQFTGATAVIVATVTVFGFVLRQVTSLAFGLPDHIGWATAVHQAIAVGLIGSSLFPWSRTANKPALLLMGLTFASLVLFYDTVTLLARS